jgi:N-acetyl sugar amidotransferase
MYNKPLHILVIPSWYHNELTPQQGRIFEEHTLMLQRAGYKVGVLYPSFSDGFVARVFNGARNKTLIYEEHNIPIYVIACASIVPYNRLINYKYIYHKANILFLKYVSKYGWPDIIHAHVTLIGGVVAFYLSKKYNIPYILTEHASALLREKINYEDRRFVKMVFENAKTIVVVSNFFKEELVKKYLIDSSKIVVVHNNINPIFFSSSKQVENNKNFIFINVGGLVKVKNHKLLIDAFTLALEKNPGIILRIAGDGALRKEIEDYIDEKGIKNRIFLLGSLSRDEVVKEINNAHALISTSQIETFGINIVEALACGKPVIATNSGGPRDIISQGDGYLVANHNPGAIADAMNKLIQDYNKFFPDEITKRCYARFSEEVIIKKLDKIFNREYQACSRCIIDTNDYPDIVFDEHGVCNICHINDEYIKDTVVTGAKGKSALAKILFKIKNKSNKRGYNCILGISGGVDSTYLALQVKKWGLRPLVIHIDNGWNSESAVRNIENILKKLGFDLHTHVTNWEAMRDMHYAFLKSSVIDIELPYENHFIAILYKIAIENNLKYILCGYNSYSEGILPPNFNHYKNDSINIKDIHKKFGREKHIQFKLFSPFSYIYFRMMHGVQLISPLNFIDYNKKEAKRILMKELDWMDHGYKHYENIFTRFYQGFILPGKFNIDKRKVHLSALICSGQITRDEALNEINNNIYGSEILLKKDKYFVLKKLGITDEEFNAIMTAPIRRHSEFKSYLNIFMKIPKFIKRSLRIIIDEKA